MDKSVRLAALISLLSVASLAASCQRSGQDPHGVEFSERFAQRCVGG